MKNPIYNRQHITEYIVFGFLASAMYMSSVLLFLYQKTYADFYYLYIGLGFFMFVIFFYALRLVNRPYDKRRAVSMLIAGSLTTLTGVVISVVLVIIGFLFYYPDLFSATPTINIIKDAPATIEPNRPTGLLFMVLLITIFGNTAVGEFVSILTAYVGKKDQTSNRPAELGN